ncbi:MAG: YitT family protein [Clostridium cadaveris]|uniref:YitT family protein n=1 Tax=Clostridium cadaveris TaxID=1529 RepID=UPI000C086137|nr:YitT family protein [Clostridium cadaveris]MDY4950425.1 YitT family protein [Clostridium cadaveris]
MGENIKAFIKDLPILTFGMFIGAIAVHFFLIPSKLIIGSITGLSIVINLLTSISLPVLIFIINAFLLVLAYFIIGKEFGVKTVYSALILSPMIAILEKIYPIEQSLMQDQWLDLLCFVLILSFSQTILFRHNASTGGLDIIAKIVNKYFHIDLGTSVSIAGGLICCTAIFVYDIRSVIIGLIGTYLNGIILDHFMIGFNSRKRVCVISKDYQLIRNFIIEDMHRGATLYPIKGGLEYEDKFEIESLMTREEFSYLMEFIKKEKIDAFITAGTVSEIYGNFGMKGIKSKPKALLEK